MAADRTSDSRTGQARTGQPRAGQPRSGEHPTGRRRRGGPVPAAPVVPALDRLIHERIRLGIISALAVSGPLPFTDLKRLLDTTDGNLSIHARKLEEAGYLRTTKSFEDRMPKTEFALTDAGRAAFEAYLTAMEGVIQAARGGP